MEKLQFLIKPRASADLPCSVSTCCLLNATSLYLRYLPCPRAPSMCWTTAFGASAVGACMLYVGKLAWTALSLCVCFLSHAICCTLGNKTPGTQTLVTPVLITTWPPWQHVPCWIYQASYPEKCQVRLLWCALPGQLNHSGGHLLWSRGINVIFHAGFQCFYVSVCLFFPKAQCETLLE